MTVDPTAPRPTGLGAVFLVLFLDLVGFSIIFPLGADMLRWYGEHDEGLLAWLLGLAGSIYPSASAAQREALFGGLLGALYSILQFVAAPFWGRVSDRWGRRPVLLLTVLGSCVGYALWMVSGSFLLLLGSRVLAGLMGGNVTVANAAVADIAPDPTQRARAMGLVGMAFGLGFILGPVIGWLSYEYGPRLDQVPALAAIGCNPFSSPALVATALSALNLVWVATRFRETLAPELRGRVRAERTANPLRIFTSGLGPGVPVMNAASFLHTALFSGMETTLVFLTAIGVPLGGLGWSPRQNGMLFAYMGFIAALVQGLIYRRVVGRTGPAPLVAIGLAALVPGFALIALVDWWASATLLIAGVTVLSVGTGLVFPGISAMVSLATDGAHQGLALGSLRSAGALGRAVGPIVAALLFFAWRPAAPYLVGAVGIVLPLLLILRLRRRAAAA